MISRYNSLDDLWYEWGDATTAIMKYIAECELLSSNHTWHFDEAWVKKKHKDGYSVTILHKGYDSDLSSQVLLSVKADYARDNKISVSTLKRKAILET